MKNYKKRTLFWGAVCSSALLFFSVVTLCVLLSKAHAELGQLVSSEEDWLRVYEIMAVAESGYDSNKVGDVNLNNKAYGVLQIREPYLVDALEWAEQNKDTNPFAYQLFCWNRHHDGLTADKLKGCPEMLPYAVYRCYMARYMNENRIGKIPTYEEVIRAHNGGGPRYGKAAWEKSTQPHMNRIRLKMALGGV